MVKWRQFIVFGVMVLSATRVVCADMTLASGAGIDCRMPPMTPNCSDQYLLNLPDALTRSAIADLGDLSAQIPGEVGIGGDDAGEVRPVCVLSDRQDNLGLCLYALFGLGLCKSVPWARKLPLGVIPGWYHDGGRFQIGPGLAVSPDCVNRALVFFVQPGHIVGNPMSQSCQATIILRWRMSQFNPVVLSPRGPPLCS